MGSSVGLLFVRDVDLVGVGLVHVVVLNFDEVLFRSLFESISLDLRLVLGLPLLKLLLGYLLLP